jgi:uncharacterized protein
MTDRIFGTIARCVNRHPKVVIAAIALLFIIAIFGMTQVTMQTGTDTYLDRNSKAGIVNHQYSQTFNTDSIVLLVKTSDPLSPDVLNYVDRLEKQICQQQHIQKAASIVDVLKLENNGEVPQSRAEVDRLVAKMPEATRATAVPSNIMTLVQVYPDRGISQSTETEVLDNVLAIIDQSDPPAGVTVTISGTPAFNAQMMDEMTGQVNILIAAAMILMVLVMGLLFTYVSHRFLPVVFVGLGIISALGIMGLFGIPFNIAVMGAFPVMIGLGIDYAIQFHSRFDEEARKGSLEDAVTMTITRTGPAVMYAMLATSLGFVAMFLSPIPMIRSFALVAIIGIVCCYMIALFGIPAIALLIHYTPKPQAPAVGYPVGPDTRDTRSAPKKSSFSYSSFLTRISVKIAKNPIPILLIAGLIAVIGFQIDSLIPIEANQNNFVPSDMPAKIELEKVQKVIGSTITADFYIQGGKVTDLETIQWIKKFQDYELAHHDELTSATSIVTYIEAYNGGKMPETQEETDTVLARIPSSIKDQYVSGSLRAMVSFKTIKMEIPQQNDLKGQMENDIAFLKPPIGITLSPVGDFEVFTSLISGMSSTKDEMTYLGFVLIFVFLAVVYRHIHAVSPLVPIILVVGWNSAIMYLVGIDYSPMTATMGSMTIGVAAEYNILMMERYSEEKERLHDNLAAIEESVSRIGTAITVSGLATFFGFSALCISSFPIVSNFGICTLIAVGFSITCTILIMPAVLSLMGQFSEWIGSRKAHSGNLSEPEKTP